MEQSPLFYEQNITDTNSCNRLVSLCHPVTLPLLIWDFRVSDFSCAGSLPKGFERHLSTRRQKVLMYVSMFLNRCYKLHRLSPSPFFESWLITFHLLLPQPSMNHFSDCITDNMKLFLFLKNI